MRPKITVFGVGSRVRAFLDLAVLADQAAHSHSPDKAAHTALIQAAAALVAGLGGGGTRGPHAKPLGGLNLAPLEEARQELRALFKTCGRAGTVIPDLWEAGLYEAGGRSLEGKDTHRPGPDEMACRVLTKGLLNRRFSLPFDKPNSWRTIRKILNACEVHRRAKEASHSAARPRPPRRRGRT